MRIPCPHCGPRSHDEFTYYGDATVRRPTATGAAAEPEFYDYVYVRDNPHGPHRELWFHQGGCHEWLVVERDTRTHAIASAVPARAVFGAGESS
jgi:heterotetrameric sarcosine oxidase delta subunit